jgi:hypothetical protein
MKHKAQIYVDVRAHKNFKTLQKEFKRLAEGVSVTETIKAKAYFAIRWWEGTETYVDVMVEDVRVIVPPSVKKIQKDLNRKIKVFSKKVDQFAKEIGVDSNTVWDSLR